MIPFRSLLGAAALGLAASTASAAVLTFDDYTSVDLEQTSIEYRGLTFTKTLGNGYQYVWDGSSPNSNGTNALIYGYGSGVTITRTGGGLFSLLNLDMAISWYNSQATESVMINGTAFTLTQGLTELTTNLFGVSQVTISGSGAGYWLADNVTAAVPLPAGLPLLAAGLAGLGLLARRRKTA